MLAGNGCDTREKAGNEASRRIASIDSEQVDSLLSLIEIINYYKGI